MVKTNVKVFVRARPTATRDDGLKLSPDSGNVQLHVPKDASMGLINNQQETFAFKYDGVLDNASQEETYTAVGHEVVDSLLSGINGTIFCYGQTGAGKTYTMAGDGRDYRQRGIVPQALHHLFREIDMRVDKIYRVKTSYLEIYNDQLYDLLSDKPGSSDSLAILEDAHGGTYVRGLTQLPADSEEAALMSFFAGDQGRSTASHILNASSSRSHCVFTIHVEMRFSEAASERAILSKLHLVDLAGSERTKKTGVSGQTLLEAQFINRSLSYLEQTVNALTKRDASYVPYRQSKLTSVLRDALGGNCKTVMVAHVFGEPGHVEETLSTLRFASRVRTLVTDVSSNESNDPGLLLRRYERQIKELKQELAMRDALSGRGRISYDDLSQAEVRAMHQLARTYLAGDADLEQLPVDTVRSIREMYKQMRAVFQATKADGGTASDGTTSTEAHASQQRQQQPAASGDDADGVGAVDASGGGFGVGTAPPGAKPALAPGTPRSPHRLITPNGPAAGASGAASPLPSSPAATMGGSLGGVMMGMAERRVAFSHFKKEAPDGTALAAVVAQRTQHLTELKRVVRASAAAVNAAKADIDRLGAEVAAAVAAAPPVGEDVVDAERHTLVAQLKAAKLKYRTTFDLLKEQRNELESCMLGVAEAKQQLIEAFNQWADTPGAALGDLEDDGTEDLDAGEAFERMQRARTMATNPDGAAFQAASRKTAVRPGALAGTTGGGGGTQRFGGVKAKGEAMRKREHELAIAAGLARG